MKNRTTFLVCFTLLFSQRLFAAADAQEANIDELSKQANYIFKGQVEKIEYRFATPESGQETGVPYTFVTYKVQREFKNSVHGKEVTLKFIGGPTGKDEVFLASDVPLMDIGDTDVLFVSPNDDSACPLVGCDKGRFREIGGLVFDDGGSSVIVDNQGHVIRGQAVALDEVMNHKVTDSIQLKMEEVASQEAVATVDNLARLTAAQGVRADPALFEALVNDAVLKNNGPIDLLNLKPVKNQNPDLPFVDKMTRGGAGAPAPEYTGGGPPAPEGSDSDGVSNSPSKDKPVTLLAASAGGSGVGSQSLLNRSIALQASPNAEQDSKDEKTDLRYSISFLLLTIVTVSGYFVYRKVRKT